MTEFLIFPAPPGLTEDMLRIELEFDVVTHACVARAMALTRELGLDHDPVKTARVISLGLSGTPRPTHFARLRNLRFAYQLARQCPEIGPIRRLSLAHDYTAALALSRGSARARHRQRVLSISAAFAVSRFTYLGVAESCAGNDAERLREISGELRRAQQLIFQLAGHKPATDSARRADAVALRLAAAAARMLPGAERCRYAEEWQAELYELAAYPRRGEWAYAARLVLCAPRLRRELRRRWEEDESP